MLVAGICRSSKGKNSFLFNNLFAMKTCVVFSLLVCVQYGKCRNIEQVCLCFCCNKVIDVRLLDSIAKKRLNIEFNCKKTDYKYLDLSLSSECDEIMFFERTQHECAILFVEKQMNAIDCRMFLHYRL